MEKFLKLMKSLIVRYRQTLTSMKEKIKQKKKEKVMKPTKKYFILVIIKTYLTKKNLIFS